MKFSNFNYPRVLIIHTVTLTTHVARVTTTMNKVHVVKVQQNILYHPETCFPPKQSPRCFPTQILFVSGISHLDISCHSNIKNNLRIGFLCIEWKTFPTIPTKCNHPSNF